VNLVKRYHINQILKTLHSHLFKLNRYNYKSAFSKARSELLANNLCSSISVHLKDQDTVMVLTTIDKQRYVLLWDLKRQEIVYKGVK
jgi:hypothetical protein